MGNWAPEEGDGATAADATLQIESLLAALDEPVSPPPAAPLPPVSFPPFVPPAPPGVAPVAESRPRPLPYWLTPQADMPPPPPAGAQVWRPSEVYGPPAKSSGGRRAWIAVGVAVVLVVAGLVAAVELRPSGGHRVALDQQAEVSPTTVVAQPTTTSDAALVRNASLAQSDLGAPWLVAGAEPMDVTATGPNPCAPSLGPPQYTAGLVEEFDYGTASNGGTGGYLFATTLSASSADLASSRAHGLVSDPAIVSCLGRHLADDYASGKNSTVLTASAQALTVSAPNLVGAYRETATIGNAAGNRATIVIDVYYVVAGRLTSQLELSRCGCEGTTFAQAQETAALAAATGRLRAAQGL